MSSTHEETVFYSGSSQRHEAYSKVSTGLNMSTKRQVCVSMLRASLGGEFIELSCEVFDITYPTRTQGL